LDESSQWFFVVVAGLFGANVGSFLNVCIYRLPRKGLSVSKPKRSFCPTCGNWIRWLDNIPLVSWLALGGCCRYCRVPISSRYFIVEALTAVLFILVALRYLGGAEAQWAAFFVVVVLVAALVVASFIDLELRILPDEITLTGMAVMPFVALLVPELHTRPVDHWVATVAYSLAPGLRVMQGSFPSWLVSFPGTCTAVVVCGAIGFVAGLYGYAGYWRLVHPKEPKPVRDGWLGGVLTASFCAVAVGTMLHADWVLTPRFQSYAAAMVGMFVGSAIVFTVGELGTRVFRKPAMGFGDVKLMGLLGAMTGWSGVIAGFFIACFLGSVVGIVLLVKYRSRYLPFGPFLAVGSLAMILWPNALGAFFQWYRTLFF